MVWLAEDMIDSIVKRGRLLVVVSLLFRWGERLREPARHEPRLTKLTHHPFIVVVSQFKNFSIESS
jgi:hypothetical protein